MQLLDVNILLYAARQDAPDHQKYATWLQDMINGNEPYAISELVLSSFIRIATNPKAFNVPSTLEEAFEFVDQVRDQPHCAVLQSSSRHWEIFRDLCHRVHAKGNLVPDAYLAALAIENDCDWISTDRDYARFPGLKWRHPLAPQP